MHFGYEKTDASSKSVAKWGLGLVVVMGLVLLVSYFSMKELLKERTEEKSISSRLAQPARLPPEPQLQTNGPRELRALEDNEAKTLKSYGWIDRKNGIVRIPIERAIELLADRKLPARQKEAQ